MLSDFMFFSVFCIYILHSTDRQAIAFIIFLMCSVLTLFVIVFVAAAVTDYH